MVGSKDLSVRSGFGWDDNPDILKAFTQRFVHDYLKLRNFHYPVTNLATVDVYGCDYNTTNGVLYLHIIGGFTPCGGVYHIGVGSNVVCSTG